MSRETTSGRCGCGGGPAGAIGPHCDLTNVLTPKDTCGRSCRASRVVADMAPVRLAYLDSTLRYRFHNRTCADWFGCGPGELIGKTLEEVLGEAVYARVRPQVQAALAGQEVTFEAELPDGRGQLRHLQFTFIPDRDPRGELLGVVAFASDITENKCQEAALRRQTETLALLNEAGRLLGRTLNPDAIYDTMQEIISRAMDCDNLIVSLYTPDDNLIRCSYAWVEGRRADATQFPAVPLASEGRGLQSQVIRTGEPLLIGDVPNDVRTCQTLYYRNADGTFRDTPSKEGPLTRSAMMVPIKLEGRVLGAAQVTSHRAAAYTGEHLHLLEALMIQVAAASRNAFLYQKAQREIADRKQAEEKVRWQAYHDALTGLPNRTLFQTHVDQALAMAERRQAMAAVLFFDLDRFKQINDSLGHAAGDRLLQAVAGRVAAMLRAEDTLARMGGDEFTLLLPDIHAPEDAARVAQRLLDALAKPIDLDGHELFITTSVGISVFPYDGTNTATLLKHADMAMYRAKEQGRGGYQLYNQSMDAAAFERLILENRLRRALENDELMLLYQPQVDLTTGRVIGAEALVRWQHPEMGMMSPASFIPLAEETGLITPLGEWVLGQACAQAAAWQAAGHPLRVAVNLSARQFEQPDLLEMIRAALDRTGLDAQWLDLEMTESTIIKNRERTVVLLQELKALGVRLSVDDFGTGYSSLSYLRRFPLDVLKVDQSFVAGMADDPQDQAIVRAVIDLAHALHLEVVAEGVETCAQQASLRALGCDAMQGFLFSPPVPADKLSTFLDAPPVPLA